MDSNHLPLSSGLLFFILAIVLFIRKSSNKQSDRILSVLLVTMATYSELIYFHYRWIITDHTLLSSYLPIDGMLLILMGVCLYYFTLSVLHVRFKIIQWRSLVHIIPLIPFLILNLRLSMMPVSKRVEWLRRDLHTGTLETNLLNIIIYLSILIYLILSYIPVNNQFKKSSYVENNGYRTDITRLRYFLLINIAFMGISAFFCFYFANEHTNILIGQIAMNIEFIFLVIISISKAGLTDTKKVATISDKITSHIPKEQELTTDKKINFSITELQADEYYNRLIAYMQEHRPYLANNCSLHLLAEKTNIQAHHLTYTLNTHIGKKLPDFINEYRVEEAKNLLRNNKMVKTKTFDEIAACCGFGSTRTFNRVFKSSTGMTPLQYHRKNR